MTAAWTIAIAGIGSLTAIAAFAISAWTAVRVARADRPVEWIISQSRRDTNNPDPTVVTWDVDLRCEGADALGFMIELHLHPGIFTREVRPVLSVGNSVKLIVVGENYGEAWIKLRWYHPKNRSKAILAWFPLFPDSKAQHEFIRASTSLPPLIWFRQAILRSPVQPGGITGRHAGWRDSLEARRYLRGINFSRWSAPMPYEEKKSE